MNAIHYLKRCGAVLGLSAALGLTAASAAQSQTLRTSILADPAMVDPITFSELIAADVMESIYEAFTGTDADGNIIPELALSWRAHDDNLGWRFNLRRGVKFHSGRDFTAKDVKWTFEQLLLPGNKGGLNTRYLGSVVGAKDLRDGKAMDLAGVRIVDDYTIDVRLTQPDVLFPIYPTWFMDSGIVEEHGADWATKASAGTGPFKFVEWNRGRNVKLAAHNDYWGEGPFIDEVDFLVVPSEDTAISMYEAGELDMIYVLALTGRRLLRDERFKDELVLVPAAQI